ncbi:LacI family DNA-binding transcriptional regulator [Amphibacillus indicireducens]
MSVTIKDIARVAGVSYSTVSKALNNSSLVKDTTKQRIIAIANKMHYEPNYAAQKLVSKQTKIIGLIWPTIDRVVLSSLVTQINKKINQTPYSMILSVDSVQASLDRFKRFQVDGIILFEESTDTTIKHDTIPLISYGVSRDNQMNYPIIDPNHEKAMYEAVKYLIELGHHSIAYIGDFSASDPLQVTKYHGYKKAMQHFGLPLDKNHQIDTKGLDWYNGYSAGNKLLKNTNLPTAIIGGSYDISAGVIRCIKEEKLNIPQDLSIISCDNVPEMEKLEVPLTCIGVPIDHLANEIVKSMIMYIENKELEPCVKKMTPVLSERNSCAKK